MKIFKTYTYTWWQIALLKLAMLCIGIAIGVHWHDLFVSCYTYLFGIGLVIGIYLAYISFRA